MTKTKSATCPVCAAVKTFEYAGESDSSGDPIADTRGTTHLWVCPTCKMVKADV